MVTKTIQKPEKLKIESMLNDINTKFDSIKSKLESLFKDDNGGAN